MSRSIWYNQNFLNTRKREYYLSNQYFKNLFRMYSNKNLTYFDINTNHNIKYITLCNRKINRGFTEDSCNKLFNKLLNKNYKFQYIIRFYILKI